jgi:hypothetical protein
MLAERMLLKLQVLELLSGARLSMDGGNSAAPSVQQTAAWRFAEVSDLS